VITAENLLLFKECEWFELEPGWWTNGQIMVKCESIPDELPRRPDDRPRPKWDWNWYRPALPLCEATGERKPHVAPTLVERQNCKRCNGDGEHRCSCGDEHPCNACDGRGYAVESELVGGSDGCAVYLHPTTGARWIVKDAQARVLDGYEVWQTASHNGLCPLLVGAARGAGRGGDDEPL